MTRQQYAYALIWAAWLSCEDANLYPAEHIYAAWQKVPNRAKAEARRAGKRIYEAWP